MHSRKRQPVQVDDAKEPEPLDIDLRQTYLCYPHQVAKHSD